jgi:signal transduction histidine kinase
LVALLPAAAIALALTGYFLLVRYVDLEAALASRGSALTRQLAPAAEYGIFSGNREELRRLADALAREPDITSITIHDRFGQVMASVGTARLYKHPLTLRDGWSGQAEDGETLWFHAKISRSAVPLDDPLASPTKDTGEALGSISLEMSRAGVLARKREIMAVTLLAALVALAIGTLLAWRLARDVTEPILSIQQAVERIRAGHLEARVARHQAQTLRMLEDGINDMATALQSGRDDLRARIKAATAEIEQKKELAEQASLAKSRFLASASHDLRQPLHALGLFAAELEHEATTESQRRLAGQITTAAGTLSELLDGLLDISRLDIGAYAPQREPTALQVLIKRVVSSHSHSARAKGLALRAVATSAWALTDARLLERIVGNLVSNAVRYSYRGGIVIGVRNAGDNLRIEVWDTGIGIAAEHQQSIFQEFFQVANPERDPGKGVGLGLALVDRLAQLLGHPVRLRSKLGRGSVFGITLPRCAPSQTGSIVATPALLGHFDARVVVFSARSPACDSLCRLLESWGCAVTCVESLSQLPSQFLSTPDLLVGQDDRCREAVAFAERMMASGASPELIFIGETPTALAHPLARRAMHLEKPLRPAKLRALMRHLLENTRTSVQDAAIR